MSLPDRLPIGSASATKCGICRTPIGDDDQTAEVKGEPCHRDCIRTAQTSSRTLRGGRDE